MRRFWNFISNGGERFTVADVGGAIIGLTALFLFIAMFAWAES